MLKNSDSVEYLRIINLYAFPSLPLQNNMKWPKHAYFKKREPRQLIFEFTSGIDRWRYIFSLSRALDPQLSEQFLVIAKLKDKIYDHFSPAVVLWVAVGIASIPY